MAGGARVTRLSWESSGNDASAARVLHELGRTPDDQRPAGTYARDILNRLTYLQPFVDVNKRTSRLAANISLIKSNLVPLSFIDLPESVYIDGLIGVYEHTRVELLRDVFVWAYERSCRRYKTVRDSLPEPDRFRLKYRDALIEVVGAIVRRGLKPAAEEIDALAVPFVLPEDLEQFRDLVLVEIAAARGQYRTISAAP